MEREIGGWGPVLLGFVGGQYVLVDAKVGVVSATILEDVLIDGSCQACGCRVVAI